MEDITIVSMPAVERNLKLRKPISTQSFFLISMLQLWSLLDPAIYPLFRSFSSSLKIMQMWNINHEKCPLFNFLAYLILTAKRRSARKLLCQPIGYVKWVAEIKPTYSPTALYSHFIHRSVTKERMSRDSLLGGKCENILTLSDYFILPHLWEV